jgi:hypothetical protein
MPISQGFRFQSPGLCAILFSAVLLGGCASEVIKQPSAELVPAPVSAQSLKTVQAKVRPVFSSGYARFIEQGSLWRLVGKLPQGEVYASASGVFTARGAHSHEAYLIVDKGMLVGFYLPVEKAYSPLMNPGIRLWEG